jgi:hypothetical protein
LLFLVISFNNSTSEAVNVTLYFFMFFPQRYNLLPEISYLT